jgi:hypothetical protein
LLLAGGGLTGGGGGGGGERLGWINECEYYDELRRITMNESVSWRSEKEEQGKVELQQRKVAA